MESILVRKNSKHESTTSRLKYYCDITYELNGEIIVSNCKVDTGSPVTIIGLHHRDLVRHINYVVRDENIVNPLVSATGNTVTRYRLPVRNFELTDDIVFPEIMINFSEDIGSRALIGMDLLSMFTFKYSQKDKLISLFYEDNYLEQLHRKQMNRSITAIMPEMIADISYEQSLPAYDNVQPNTFLNAINSMSGK